MPRLIHSLPKYRKHRASGQAIVTLDGKDHYLGPHGSRGSRREYDRLVGEWQQNGRRLPSSPDQTSVVVLLAAYWKFAQSYYTKNGKPTGELPGVKAALGFLRRLYGDTAVCDFGPLALENVQSLMVESGHSRKYVNKNIGRIKRCFKWGVAKEMVPVSVYQALATVGGLRKGKTLARDCAPIMPVWDRVVQVTLPLLPEVVQDMIHFQRWTGCRPGEVFSMRPRDVDRSKSIWCYVPESHKTEHHERNRVILIGPKARKSYGPYLLRDENSPCFLRPSGHRFQRWNYASYISRACDRAFPPPEPLAKREKETIAKWYARLTAEQRGELKEWRKAHYWSPNQLRHATATEIRKQFGLEAAQVTLGHSNANVTQIYAERDLNKAAEIMREVG